MELVALNPQTGKAWNEVKLGPDYEPVAGNPNPRNFFAPDAPSSFHLQLYSCFHYGHNGCRYEDLLKTIGKHARKKNHFGIFMGDLGEAVIHTDQKRFAVGQGQRGLTIRGPLGEYVVRPEEAAEMPWQYILAEQDLITPFRDYWKLLMPGNHDLKAFHGKTNHLMLPAVRNGIPFGGYQTRLKIHDELKLFFVHGFGGFPIRAMNNHKLMAGRDNALFNKLNVLAADVDLMATGHHHMGHVLAPNRMTQVQSFEERGKLVNRRMSLPPAKTGFGRFVHPESRWYASVPSFRDGVALCHTDYAEIGGYPAAEIGYVNIEVRNDEIRDVRVVVI